MKKIMMNVLMIGSFLLLNAADKLTANTNNITTEPLAVKYKKSTSSENTTSSNLKRLKIILDKIYAVEATKSKVNRVKLKKVIYKIEKIIDSKEFASSNYKNIKDSLDKILEDLGAAGIKTGADDGNLGNMPGGNIEIPDGKTDISNVDIGGFGAVVDMIHDEQAHYGLGHGDSAENSTGMDGSIGHNPMDGKIGQDAADYDAECARLHANAQSGNGGLNTRNKVTSWKAKQCQKALKEKVGIEETDAEKRSWTNDKGSGGALTPNNKDGDDPADGGYAPVKKTAKQKATEKKLHKEMNKHKKKVGPKGVKGSAGGGDDDTRGDTGDSGSSDGGMMQYTPGLAGGTDDPRLEDNKGNGSGGIKTIKKVQTGGATGAGEHR